MRDFKLLKLFALFKLRIKHYTLHAVFLLTFFPISSVDWSSPGLADTPKG